MTFQNSLRHNFWQKTRRRDTLCATCHCSKKTMSPPSTPRPSLFGPIVVLLLGFTIRLNAHAWAWPDSYSFSGDRADTDWARQEQVYVDISLAVLALGVGLILLCWHHRLTHKTPETEIAQSSDQGSN